MFLLSDSVLVIRQIMSFSELLFPARQIMVEGMYTKVFTKKPTHFKRSNVGGIKKEIATEKSVLPPGSRKSIFLTTSYQSPILREAQQARRGK
jgi:hypothetical protein